MKPAGVSETAWTIATAGYGQGVSDTEDLASVIDAAIIAERERCARVVEKGLGLSMTVLVRRIREGGEA